MKKNVIKLLIGLAFSVCVHGVLLGLYSLIDEHFDNEFLFLITQFALMFAALIVYIQLQINFDSFLLLAGAAVGNIGMTLFDIWIGELRGISGWDALGYGVIFSMLFVALAAILVIDLLRLAIPWIFGAVRESVRRRRYAKNADQREPDLLDKIEKE